MYCPVDGTEWREGITRCPQHDVDLVDEPPDLEEPERARPSATARLDAAAGPASVAVALAGIVYAVSGAASALWKALNDDVGPFGAASGVTAFDFAQSASWAIGLGSFGCLAAAVLAKTYSRLRLPAPPRADEGDDGDLPPESGSLFMTVVSTLAICFAIAWIGIAVLIAWKTRDLGEGLYFTGEDEDLGHLYAYQSAAAACTLGSIAVMGSLLMARAHDRLAGLR
jgi:hypothetical protein